MKKGERSAKKATKEIRRFSLEFKKEKVKMIEEGKVTVLQISRLYEVSATAIYKWLKKYGRYWKTEIKVVEKKSESQKNIELLKKIEQLERVIGQQQLEILYKEEIIEQGSKIIGVDLEKKYDTRL